MKKTNLFMVALGIVSISMVTSCKKDKKEEVTPEAKVETPKQKIIGATWKMTAWTSSPAWNGYTDIYAVTSSCYLDNTMVFQSNGVNIGDEGATKCNAADPQITRGTWIFTQEGEHLRINELDYKVLVNNGNILKLSLNAKDKSATPYVNMVWTLTFEKI